MDIILESDSSLTCSLLHISTHPFLLGFASLLVSVFSSLRTVPWSIRTKQKLTHSCTNLHTAHSGRMQRPRAQENNEENKQTNKRKQVCVRVKHLSSAGETEGGIKTNPACSPSANAVHAAVHANSMTFLYRHFLPF